MCVCVCVLKGCFISPAFNMTTEGLLIGRSFSRVRVEGSFQQAFINHVMCATHMLCQVPGEMQVGAICGLCSSVFYRIPSKKMWGLKGGEQENGTGEGARLSWPLAWSLTQSVSASA